MKMIDNVMEVLQKQGFLPQREDFGIMFKYQITNFLYLFDENDETYFSMYVPCIFEVDDENIDDVLKAINIINNEMKVLKLVVNANNVWCCFEEKLTENTDIEEIVSFAVVSLSQSQIKFFERLKEV
ncbi:MAG: hypothetical protein J6R06_03060 [Bacteroidales bacterium]|jgi:hypothetical protein|nr:hypothetical protein [Bacteroidales bacterium]MBO7201198.1 hypothetical protein [Bacteroidales bacterium]